MDIRQVTLVLFFAACVVTLSVTLFYGLFTSWYKQSSGRYIFALFLSESAVLSNSLLRYFNPGQEWTAYTGIILFGGYVIAMTAMGIGIVRATFKSYITKAEAKEKEFEDKFIRPSKPPNQTQE